MDTTTKNTTTKNTITVTIPAGLLEQIVCYLADRGEVAATLSAGIRSAQVAEPADGPTE